MGLAGGPGHDHGRAELIRVDDRAKARQCRADPDEKHAGILYRQNRPVRIEFVIDVSRDVPEGE